LGITGIEFDLSTQRNNFSFVHVNLEKLKTQYRWTSLYSRDRDYKNMLAYKEFAYKKTNDHSKLEARFQKKRPFFNCIYQGWPKCGPPKIFCGPCIKFWLHNLAIYDTFM